MKSIKKILVPVDFTAYSDRALEVAAQMACQFRARILLLHVIEQFTYTVSDTFEVLDHYPALKSLAEPQMEILMKGLRKKGLRVDGRIERGNPYLEILKACRKDKADMIVMGTHGRTGIPHLVMGSVAENVVRMATCPVMTVPGDKKAKAGFLKNILVGA